MENELIISKILDVKTMLKLLFPLSSSFRLSFTGSLSFTSLKCSTPGVPLAALSFETHTSSGFTYSGCLVFSSTTKRETYSSYLIYQNTMIDCN